MYNHLSQPALPPDHWADTHNMGEAAVQAAETEQMPGMLTVSPFSITIVGADHLSQLQARTSSTSQIQPKIY